MIVQALAFYLFAAILIAAGVMVVSARNPVHSVLFLILAFFNAAGLFVLMGAEFLAPGRSAETPPSPNLSPHTGGEGFGRAGCTLAPSAAGGRGRG